MDILNPDIAAKVADNLLRIGAVRLRPSQPFTWASGWRSPIYCDNRSTLSFADVRGLIAQGLAQAVRERYGEAEVIAGVATGAIAHGILAAEALGLPFVYVRPKPKEHGLGNQVEGLLLPGAKVAVVEDLISTGGSSLLAVKALRDHGAEVLGMAAIFTYGFAEADKRFAEAGCRVVALSDYGHLIPRAVACGMVGREEVGLLEQWREHPSEWGQ